jgi:hypothetical protein
MRAKSSSHTKAAFGTGKQILNKMQEKGWTVAPGGQLIKPKPKPKPRTKGDGAILIRTQDGVVAFGGKEPIDTETMEPVVKSPKLEPKVIRNLQKEATSAPLVPPQSPAMIPPSSGIPDADEGGLIQVILSGPIFNTIFTNYELIIIHFKVFHRGRNCKDEKGKREESTEKDESGAFGRSARSSKYQRTSFRSDKRSCGARKSRCSEAECFCFRYGNRNRS